MHTISYYICSEKDVRGDGVILGGDEAHHLSRVSRAKAGDMVGLLDGRGTIIEATVVKIQKTSVELRIESKRTVERPYPVDLALAVIKAGRMDLVAEKCTEIGVRRIIPYLCERSVWKGDEEDAGNKRERLVRKVESACKQCGQPWFPEIMPIIKFQDMAGMIPGYWKTYLADAGGRTYLHRCDVIGKGPVLGITGPEGGLSDCERSQLADAGAESLSLGRFRLRSETAAICLAFRLLVEGESTS
ncbi:MAG: 16S rRNA (uracil(1498)-N(3))-methyltransferase [Candidatus Krumholzibacteria bacterium]|jgi:16S rRNA (uracil1498-N3)-methyltransferase|nr:16S rRNA (uracil(1498)-N(3))-methyltransferase [Candidatus Krumholzibacteria bacterium]